jgi:hypothetical protein
MDNLGRILNVQRDAATRRTLLNKAYEIRHALENARTPADLNAILCPIEKLDTISDKLINSDMDEMFITDTMLWTRRAKIGSDEHKYAISAIKEYIVCLEKRKEVRNEAPSQRSVRVSKDGNLHVTLQTSSQRSQADEKDQQGTHPMVRRSQVARR